MGVPRGSGNWGRQAQQWQQTASWSQANYGNVQQQWREEGAVDQYAPDEADGLTARPQQLQEDPWSLGDSRRRRPTVTHQAPDQQTVTRPAPGLGMETAPGLHTQQAHGRPMEETPGLHTQQAPGPSFTVSTNSDDEAEFPPHRHRDVDLHPSDSAVKQPM